MKLCKFQLENEYADHLLIASSYYLCLLNKL